MYLFMTRYWTGIRTNHTLNLNSRIQGREGGWFIFNAPPLLQSLGLEENLELNMSVFLIALHKMQTCTFINYIIKLLNIILEHFTLASKF